ncbi:MAG: T9SS type B sorting domain-containing protein, partial [Flavobacteriaceae bacterium]
ANAIADPTAYSNVDSPYSQTIYIRVENTDTLSPCYDIAIAQLLVEPLAEPVITSDYTHLCVNADGSVDRPVELNSNITDPNYTFEWFHNGVSIPGATESIYLIDQFGGEGEYYVIATSTLPYFECESEPSDVITIGLSGSASIVYIESTNAFYDQQDIIVTVDGYGEYLYQLDNGPLQSTGHFVNVSPGAHTVTVYDVLPGGGDVDDDNNCRAITQDNVSVVNYPHYFTPNGDGYHDHWNITGLNAFHNAELFIFDRYGKLLKQLNPLGEGWDGTYNGNPLPSSDYWFKVVYDEPHTDSEGIITTRRKEFKAHFSLKR